MVSVEICDRLTEVRKHFNYSQAQFAKLLQTKQSRISDFERHIMNPPGWVVTLLIQKLDINANWLIAGRGDMFIKQNNEGSNLTDYNSFDNDCLQSVVIGVEEFLSENNKKLDPENKAELIAGLYEYFIEEANEERQTGVEYEFSTKKIKRVLKLKIA